MNGDQPGDCFPELCVEIRRGDLGFGHRVEVGVDDDNAQDGILIISAIQLEPGSTEMLAIDEYLAAALRVLRRGMRPSKFLGAWGQKLEVREIAVQDGQVLDKFGIELNGDVRAISLELRGFRGHFNLLRGGADLELSVDVGASIGRDGDVLEFDALEALRLEMDRVDVRNQVRHRVVAALVGRGFSDGAPSLASHSDFRVGNGSPRRVSGRTKNAAENRLAGCDWRPKTAEKRECCHSRKT